MAAYAIVTNGTEWQLYSTVTREPIDQAEARIDGDFAVALPATDDFAALDCFLRLSPENLLRFSRAQVDGALIQLRGSAAEPTRKYIPELHVPREAVGTALEQLLHSSQPALALVADSGIGKTCTMCHRAVMLSDAGRAGLFFRGSELGSNLLQQIADEFAWTFSEQLSPPARSAGSLKRLPTNIFSSSSMASTSGSETTPISSWARSLATLARRGSSWLSAANRMHGRSSRTAWHSN